MCCAVTSARADEPLRAPHVYRVEANLPAPQTIGPSFDPREIKLVHQLLEHVVERKLMLAPNMQLTFITGTRLLTLNLFSRALLSLSPTGFTSGTVTLQANF